MSYDQAIRFLHGLRMFGANFGLETTLRLAELAGHPQRQLRFIHVAGTNGKGSTCAMLESIYRAAGRRVGLFTSPHLVAFGERMQINRQLISPEDVARLVGALPPLLREFPAKSSPTFFEIVTVMALRYFAEQKCDLVIWETGLGGRLDATNIVTPLASVITNIGFDHQQWLGDTLDKIAAEKAGIIKPGVPVITAATPGRGLEVIAGTARQRSAPLTVVDEADTTRPPLDTLPLPLLGRHQSLNAATALATVRALAATLPVTQEQMVAGLAGVHWPGRMQLVKTSAGHIRLLDGAHNPESVAALAAALASQFSGRRPTFVLGVLSDKDWRAMCQLLAPLAVRMWLIPVNSERTLSPNELLPACRAANATAPMLVCASLREALEKTADDPFVVITGSLYLIGEAMELLRLSPVPARDERGLNEWTGGPGGTARG